MLASLVAALLLQAVTPDQPQAPAPPPAPPERDSTTGYHPDRKKPPKRIEVTPEHLATAFRDPAARSILALAREARTRQDSALRSYDATTYQRIGRIKGMQTEMATM